MTGKAASVSDYRALAKARLPNFLFEYLDGGSYDEVTLRRNVEDLQSVALRQRVLRDVAEIDLSTELFGKSWAMPVGLGPVGLSGFYARRGEVQAAKAAAAANIPLALSTLSACSIAEVARAAPPWFQLYIVKDRGLVSAMIERAREARQRVDEGLEKLNARITSPDVRRLLGRAVNGTLPLTQVTPEFIEWITASGLEATFRVSVR